MDGHRCPRCGDLMFERILPVMPPIHTGWICHNPHCGEDARDDKTTLTITAGATVGIVGLKTITTSDSCVITNGGD